VPSYRLHCIYRMADGRGGRAFDTIPIDAAHTAIAIAQAKPLCDDPPGLRLRSASLIAANGEILWALRPAEPDRPIQEGDRSRNLDAVQADRRC
jgi:hypothetical protein